MVEGQARDSEEEREGEASAPDQPPLRPCLPGWAQAPPRQTGALTTGPDPQLLVLLFFPLGVLSLSPSLPLKVLTLQLIIIAFMSVSSSSPHFPTASLSRVRSVAFIFFFYSFIEV